MANKIKTLNRNNILVELIFNWSSINTGSFSSTWSATNLTYNISFWGYQSQKATFWATSSVTTATTINGVKWISFSFYPTANNKNILTFTWWSVAISSWNAITTSWLTNPVIYVDNIQTSTVVLNKIQTVTITFDSINLASSNLWASSYTWDIIDFRYLSNVSINDIEIFSLEKFRYLWWQSYWSLFDWLQAFYDLYDWLDIVWWFNLTDTWSPTVATDPFWTAKGKTYWTSKYSSVISTDTKLNITWAYTVFAYATASTLVTSWQVQNICTNVVTDANNYWWLYQLRQVFSTTAKWAITNWWSAGFQSATWTTTVDTNPHFIVWTFNGSNSLKIYVDWVLEWTNSTSQTLSTTWKTWFRISWWEWSAWSSTPTWQWWSWDVYCAWLLNREMTADEIKLLDRVIKTTYPYPF